MIKNVIFDIGGVLMDYRWIDVVMGYGLTREKADEIGRKFLRHKTWHDLDRGVITEEEAIAAYEKEFPEEGDLFRYFFDHKGDLDIPRTEVVERFYKLKKAGYSIYLLSNYSKCLFEAHYKDISFSNLIDGKVISYEDHLMKPEPEIYERLLTKYDLVPEECIFFDDRDDNVEAAKKLRINAYRTLTSEDVVYHIRKLLEMAEN